MKSSVEPLLVEWLRREYEVYAALEGPFIPRLLGWDDDGERALLVLEDLSDAEWTWSWDSVRVEAVVRAIDEIALRRFLRILRRSGRPIQTCSHDGVRWSETLNRSSHSGSVTEHG